MTTKRKDRKPLGYTTQTIFVDRDDGKGGMTGGMERMRFPVYDQPDYCEAFRRFRMEQRITLRKAAKRLGLAPSELSALIAFAPFTMLVTSEISPTTMPITIPIMASTPI